MKSIILFFLFIGIIFIVIGVKKNDCEPPKIQYRYIPRDFNDEQMMQTPLLGMYGKLFTANSPWEESVGYPGIFYDKKEKF